MSVEYRADDETGEGEAVAHFLHQWSGGAERGGRDPLADEMIDHATDDLASAYVAQKGFMGSSFDRPDVVSCRSRGGKRYETRGDKGGQHSSKGPGILKTYQITRRGDDLSSQK